MAAASQPSPSPDVARARFASFIARALAGARDRGMTDSAIHKATGIPPATFHRWQKGDFKTSPDLDKIRRFCEGLGVSPAGALAALGLSPERDNTEPDAPMPPEIRRILRTLADPNVSDSDKLVLREFLKMAAERAERGGR